MPAFYRSGAGGSTMLLRAGANPEAKRIAAALARHVPELKIGARQTARIMIYSIIPTHSNTENVMENPHISALRDKHDALKARIASEMSRPLPDMGILAALKKQKLRVKEAMHRP